MQRKQGLQHLLWTIMKLTYYQIILCAVFAGMVSAKTSRAQDILNQTVTIRITDQKVKDALFTLEKNSNVKFVYSSRVIDADRRISLHVTNAPMGDVLAKLLRPLHLKYEVSGRQIVLDKEDKPTWVVEPEITPANVETTVSGKVTDEKGGELPGVSVVLKGTQRGTITDTQGKYMVGVPDELTVLIFSFVGYSSQEIIVGNRTELNVSLKPDNKSLQEVVVIGYGAVSRRDLTGSVGQVSVNDLQKAPVRSFDEALAGRVAGVQVSSNDGQPGTLPNIVIRGANSLTQDNSPLYVVDGFPIEGNNNNSINPSDIESIDILKDASATAIYGARGANGVIIITTKRGKIGAPVITYNGYYGIQKDIKRIELMKPYEFVKLQLEANGPMATETYLTSVDKTLEDYKKVEGIDWNAKILQVAPMQNHNISVAGGTEKSRYSISGSYLGQDGIFKNTGFRRYQGRVTLDQTLSRKLKLGLNTNYSFTKEFGTIATSNGGSTSASLMYSVWSYRPLLDDAKNSGAGYEDALSDPLINPATDYRTNPLVQIENELRETLGNSLITNGYLEYLIVNGLRLRIAGGLNKNTYQFNAFNNSKTRTGGPGYPQSLGPNGSINFNNSNNFTNENTLSYSKSFNKDHNLSVVAGYTQQAGKLSTFGGSAVQIANESLELSGLDEGTPRTISSSISNWSLQSFLGRINYNFKSKYLLTVSARADGSSKFSEGRRWGYFPSAALAYRLSNEDFIKDLKIISDAKVRVSYGATGNNRVSDFAYLSTFFTSNSSGYSFGNGVPTRGSYAGGLGNPDLKWETTKQFNTGIDLALWDDRLAFTGDYYYKRTNDLLLNAQLPYGTGYAQAFKNIGSVSNSGIELAINSVNTVSKNFRWNTSFNISFNRNKVLALTENQEALTSATSAVYNSNPVYIAKIGKPIAQFYGVVYQGVYQYADFNQQSNGTYILKDELSGNSNARGNIRPGDPKYKDLNNDGTITLSDYTVIGDPNPDFIGGLNNNFEYQGFDLNVFFQFSYGNDVLNANRALFENLPSYNTNQYASYSDRWSPTNQTSNIPRYGGSAQSIYTSRLIEDGSYLRLKTVALGYSFSNEVLKPLKIKSVRVYASAQNLITWTRYSGIDPEVSTRHSTLTPGFDYSPYPRARTMTLGLIASF